MWPNDVQHWHSPSLTPLSTAVETVSSSPLTIEAVQCPLTTARLRVGPASSKCFTFSGMFLVLLLPVQWGSSWAEMERPRIMWPVFLLSRPRTQKCLHTVAMKWERERERWRARDGKESLSEEIKGGERKGEMCEQGGERKLRRRRRNEG